MKNGKCYVGKSMQREGRRKNEHLSDAFNIKKANYDCLFYRAIRKYKIDVWLWQIVAEDIPIKELDWNERFYIFYYSSCGKFGYNSDTGGSNGKQFATYVKKKISDAHIGRVYSTGWHHTEEAKKKISAAGKGRHLSEEAIKRAIAHRPDMSGKNSPMFGKHHSKETKQKLSATKVGDRNPMFGKHPGEETMKKRRASIPKAEAHHNSKLTWDMVHEIRTKYSTMGYTSGQLSSEYGVDFTVICKILNGKSWKEDTQAEADRITKMKAAGPLNAILDWAKVREIRNKFATGNYTQKQLGIEYGVDRTNIGLIVHNKSWKEEPGRAGAE